MELIIQTTDWRRANESPTSTAAQYDTMGSKKLWGSQCLKNAVKTRSIWGGTGSS